MQTLLVDGTNILMRALKATYGKVVLSTDDGVPTGSLLVFINTLSRFVKHTQPDRVAVCWDGGRSTMRMAIFPEYKASRNQRDPEEEEVKDSAFALAKEFLTLANVWHVGMPGVEADDLVAGYWWTIMGDPDPAERVVILSGDKDFFQLLNHRTTQLRPGKEIDLWTEQRVEQEIGAEPTNIPYVMALTGDTSDGIPGVPRFGNKTAVKCLAKYGWNVERMLQEEPKLAEHHDTFARNLRLVDLRGGHPPGSYDLPRFSPTGKTNIAYFPLLQFLQRYQLASVRSRIEEGTLWHEPQQQLAVS